MWVGVLGPLLVRDGDGELDAGPAKQRIVLAALGLRPGMVVSLSELIGVLWDAAPPGAPAVTARNHVKRLRHALGPAAGARVITRAPGYLLQAGPGEVDALVFGRLCDSGTAASRAGNWQLAADQLDQALALWRGTPLADVPSEVLHREHVPSLEQLRLQAVEQRIEAWLNLGRHGELIPELHLLIARHPLREAFHGQLMTALYRDGRQGEALDAYQRARANLVEELGTDPSARLRELHQRILAGDRGLIAVPAAKAAAGARPAGQVTGPRQLPAGPVQLAGREAELSLLSEYQAERGTAPGTVMISAISGMAGVGKTALALHWAHQVAEQFPDGQLYVNLRGFGPDAAPADPAAAVRVFLAALGVPATRIPADPAAQASQYRSLLAGQRVLVLLDNARDEDQVRPLLPAGPASLVLVTSRTRLTGLAATDAARLVNLDVLSEDGARQMLARRLDRRAAAEPGAVAELTALCGRLPLALAITAARAADHPGYPLAALAAELRTQPLAALETGDPASSARAVFSWSYHRLSSASARMFRLLGLHPGPDVTVPAAASLTGLPADQARDLLRELTRGCMLAEPVPGRYALHRLLRCYATERARAAPDQQARHEAIRPARSASGTAGLARHRIATGLPHPPGIVMSDRQNRRGCR